MVEDVPDVVPQFLAAFGVWLDLSEGSARAPALGQMDTKAQKPETFLPSIQQARLGFVELQFPAFQPAFEALEIFRSSAFGTENDEVIGVSHHNRHLPAVVVDGFIQFVEVDIRQKGRDDTSLGRPLLIGQGAPCAASAVFLDDGCLEPCPNEGEHGAVADSARH